MTKSLAAGRVKSRGRKQGRESVDKGGCEVHEDRLGRTLEALVKNFILSVERSQGGFETGE